MQTTSEPTTRQGSFRLPLWLGVCLFLGIALFFLWEKHRAHILGALPYLLLLLCPIIHVFIHRGHGNHTGQTHTGHDTSARLRDGEEDAS